MDLPTCPSCGQSVLDDDAADCPFCGAAMDGKRTAAEPKPVKKKPTKKKAERPAANDDPFSMESTPTAASVIPCARKPVRGRTFRVKCPMCDSNGFIPKKAIGRQVKCANKECLVPVFTAENPNAEAKAPRAPSRVSSGEVAKPKEPVDAGEKKPYLMYGIVVGGIVTVGMGVLWYFNSLTNNAKTVLGPAPMNFGGGASNYEDEPEELVGDGGQTSGDSTKKPNVSDPAPNLTEVAENMVKAARTSAGNRDKAWCRRQTADAFLRLGDTARANEEFSQMSRVARDLGRDTSYYRVGPRLHEYWLAIKNRDAATAEPAYADAKSVKDSIPGSGSAVEAGIQLMAAMMREGDAEGAKQLYAHQSPDRSIESQMDAVRQASWEAVTAARRDQLLPAANPLVVFGWHDPIHTGVAHELAIHGEFEAAISWLSLTTAEHTLSDSCAVIAAEIVRQKATDQSPALVAAATGLHPHIALRTKAVLARTDGVAMDAVLAEIDAIPVAKSTGMGDFEEMANGQIPSADADLLLSQALLESAASASLHSKPQAGELIRRAYSRATATVPPAPLVRRAGEDVADRKKTEKKIAAQTGIRSADRLKSVFFSYRTALNRVLTQSESRRTRLVYGLCRVLDIAGTQPLKDAMAVDAGLPLRKELGVDNLQGLLFVAAAVKGDDFKESTGLEQSWLIPLRRTEPPSEVKIMPQLINTARAFLANKQEGILPLERLNALQGLGTALCRCYSMRLAADAEEPAEFVQTLIKVRNGGLREQLLLEGLQEFSRKGNAAKSIGAVNKLVELPSQRVAGLYGVICGELERKVIEAEEAAKEAAKKKTDGV